MTSRRSDELTFLAVTVVLSAALLWIFAQAPDDAADPAPTTSSTTIGLGVECIDATGATYVTDECLDLKP